MKILLASDTWSPMVNGVVRSVELLYHQLLALGHDVRVVTLAQNGHSHEENGILYVGSISAERVYPGVRISAAGALPTVSCPPAIPIVVSGEVIGPAALELFAAYGVETVSVVKPEKI